MKIVIETVPVDQQRKFHGKPIMGDWFFTSDTDLTIRMLDFEDWRYNLLYARHEMDEAFLCKAAGITTKEVDDFCDLSETDPRTGENNPDSFSGYGEAPYQAQHNDALAAEWIFSRLLHVNWSEYGKAVEEARSSYNATF